MLARQRPILETAVSSTTTYRSPVIWMDGQSDCSVHCQSTGTNVGTSLKVYGSNIYSEADGKTLAQSFTDNEWVEVPLTGVTLPAGAAWTDMIRLPKGTVPFACICVVYVNASGSGTLKLYFVGR